MTNSGGIKKKEHLKKNLCITLHFITKRGVRLQKTIVFKVSALKLSVSV